nr:immunoglobulin heavy chain junction region [Macaca mulatta]MOX60297.1 immunoglobulin heavy chain junction region [Macaca mulatta]MOX61148.1 immunoglobulin heavy chain junction region [Macaca mulatta]MOX61222.1 immunoglobulin heavy chain junction region [Macaca mulatta]MOX63097.1 immunoglobulin heavy chain junction region [Macaca mulatta]
CARDAGFGETILVVDINMFPHFDSW